MSLLYVDGAGEMFKAEFHYADLQMQLYSCVEFVIFTWSSSP